VTIVRTDGKVLTYGTGGVRIVDENGHEVAVYKQSDTTRPKPKPASE
jgi:hypothetical protein